MEGGKERGGWREGGKVKENNASLPTCLHQTATITPRAVAAHASTLPSFLPPSLQPYTHNHDSLSPAASCPECKKLSFVSNVSSSFSLNSTGEKNIKIDVFRKKNQLISHLG